MFQQEKCEIQLLQGRWRIGNSVPRDDLQCSSEPPPVSASCADFLLKLSPFHSPFALETLRSALPEAIKGT